MEQLTLPTAIRFRAVRVFRGKSLVVRGRPGGPSLPQRLGVLAVNDWSMGAAL